MCQNFNVHHFYNSEPSFYISIPSGLCVFPLLFTISYSIYLGFFLFYYKFLAVKTVSIKSEQQNFMAWVLTFVCIENVLGIHIVLMVN